MTLKKSTHKAYVTTSSKYAKGVAGCGRNMSGGGLEASRLLLDANKGGRVYYTIIRPINILFQYLVYDVTKVILLFCGLGLK